MSCEITPYKFRKPDLDRYDDSSLVEWFNKHQAAQELALQTPLRTGLHVQLNLEVPPQNPNPNARKLPQTPPSGPATVILRDELQPGVDWYSQVWTADCLDSPETRLILKIIQPSICTGPPGDHIDPYYEPYDFAHNEAWVYRHLAHYQGLLIPYFFGVSTASTIVTPCGEEAWVIVLEYIPGGTIDALAKSTSASDIRTLCALGLKAVQEFIYGGWSLEDIRMPNFIFTGGPGSWEAVIIDLFLSKPLKTPANVKFEVGNSSRTFFLEFSICAYPFDNDLEEWAQKNLPQFVWSNPREDWEEEEIHKIDVTSLRFDIE